MSNLQLVLVIGTPRPSNRLESLPNTSQKGIVKRALSVYSTSEIQAEQKMWDFIMEQKPGFFHNTVLPNINMGGILSDTQLASSAVFVRSLYEGDDSIYKNVLPQWIVNVKDTARLHVAALGDPQAEDGRILAFAQPVNCNEILTCLRRMYPEKRFPKIIEDYSKKLNKVDTQEGRSC